MKILVASSIHQSALDRLSESHEVVCAFGAPTDELARLIVDCDALVFRSGVQITADVMRAAPNLKLIIRAGSGMDNIDVPFVKQQGYEFVRIPGPGARAVAEMAFTLMLTLSRNVLAADSLLRKGRWAKHEMTGHLLQGKVLGIVGAGNIGTVVGQMGHAWGMEVIGCVEHPSEQQAERLAAHGIRMVDCDEVFRSADYVSIHVPLKDSTRYLVDERALSLMKPTAFLVNLARGGVVDEQALYRALTEGRLAGAGLDVHENEGEGKISPLAELPNVVLTPHIGAGTFDTQIQIGNIIVETVESFVARQAEAAATAQAK